MSHDLEREPPCRHSCMAGMLEMPVRWPHVFGAPQSANTVGFYLNLEFILLNYDLWIQRSIQRFTSLTILLIFLAFFSVKLSSVVRLWKCDVPFILFKSFLYFSCKEIWDDWMHATGWHDGFRGGSETGRLDCCSQHDGWDHGAGKLYSAMFRQHLKCSTPDAGSIFNQL